MRRSLALSVGLTLLASLPATAATPVQPLDPPAAPAAVTAEDGITAWFVELSGPPVAEGGSPAALAQEKAAFRSAARKEGIQLKERFSYDKLFNGRRLPSGPAKPSAGPLFSDFRPRRINSPLLSSRCTISETVRVGFFLSIVPG